MNEIVSLTKEIEFKTMLNKITSISLEHTLMPDEESTIKGDLIVSGTYKQTQASHIDNPFSYKIPVDIVLDEKYDLSNLIIDIDDFTYEVLNENLLKVNIDLILDKLELKNKEEEKETEDELISIDDLFGEKEQKEKLEIPKEKIETLEFEDEIHNRNVEENDNCLVKEIEDSINEDLKETEEIKDIKIEDNNDENYNNEVNELANENEKDNYKNDNSSSESLFSNLSTNETYSTYSIYIVRENYNLEEVMSKYNVTKEKLEEYNDLNNLKIGNKLIIPTSNE